MIKLLTNLKHLLILIGFIQTISIAAQTQNLMLHQTKLEKNKSTVQFYTSEGWILKISFLNKLIIRVQLASPTGFDTSYVEKFGFVRSKWDEIPLKITEKPAFTLLQTDSLCVKVDKQNLLLTILDEKGNEITGERATRSWSPEGGGCLRFSMPRDEHFFGFGFQRKTIDCRGYILPWKREYRSENATMPFFLSTRGYGFLSNNTWEQEFDFKSIANGYDIKSIGGQIDFYIIRGPQFSLILNNYIQLTGAPQLIPKWGIGLYYICRYYSEQQEVVDIAKGFRKNDIPCDFLSLEPGWEDKSYSMKWIWSPERFPNPSDMIKQLNDNGFKMGLWESGVAPDTGYLNPLLRKKWYEQRLNNSVNIGVSFFKQDDPYPRMLESTEMYEAKFKNETDGAKLKLYRSVKSLANSLYSETAINEFRRLTGKRTFFLFNSYVSAFGSHRWPTGWAGDSEAGKGMLNAGLAAQSMVTLDMDASNKKGIHLGYLSPIALIDSWAYYDEPWLYPSFLTEAHRFYAKLRYRLAPYLYSTQAQSHFTGLPMMRSMLLNYQNDSVTWNIDKQYMLGDALLVGTDSTIYLPSGEWVDYWNGERILSKGQWAKRKLKGSEGGTLFIKSGSIIPMQGVTPNLQQEKPTLIYLDVYPSTQNGKGWLYEDDGVSFNYEKGQYAKTEFSSINTSKGITINANSRTGTFDEIAPRAYLLQVHNLMDVRNVNFNNIILNAVSSKDSLLYTKDKLGWWFDKNIHTLYIKPSLTWHLGSDFRGEKCDPERDSLYVDKNFVSEQNGFVCKIETGFTNEANLKTNHEIIDKPNKLVVTANPPQRILQSEVFDEMSWLPFTTTIFVELKFNDKLAIDASNTVLLEVFDETGKLIRSAEKKANNGIVIFKGSDNSNNTDKNNNESSFAGEKYVVEKTRFRISSPGIEPVEIKIKKPLILKGNY